MQLRHSCPELTVKEIGRHLMQHISLRQVRCHQPQWQVTVDGGAHLHRSMHPTQVLRVGTRQMHQTYTRVSPVRVCLQPTLPTHNVRDGSLEVLPAMVGKRHLVCLPLAMRGREWEVWGTVRPDPHL